MSKSFASAISIAALITSPISASTTLSSQAPFGSGDGTGSWSSQSFKLNDLGFTKSGEALSKTAVFLDTITLVKGSAAYADTTQGKLWLAVMTNPSDIKSVKLLSSNKINVRDLTENTKFTFKFPHAASLNVSSQYSIRAILDNGNGTLDNDDTLANLRLKIGADTISGKCIGNKDLSTQYPRDLDLQFTVTPTSATPQNSTDKTKAAVPTSGPTILSIGGIGLIVRKPGL